MWPTKNGYPIASLLREVSNKNEKAEKVWHKFIFTLVSTIQMLTVTFDPKIIVIGGGISKIGTILLKDIQKVIGELETKSPFLSSLNISNRLVIADQEVFFGALGAALIGNHNNDIKRREIINYIHFPTRYC